MCLLVLYTRQWPGLPLLVGANREEEYGRPSRPPRWLEGHPEVFAGQDLRAGGTWLGVNRAGLLAAVTNRLAVPGPEAADPGLPSRGLLCLDALRHASAAEALTWCRHHLQVQRYRPFNLLLADGEAAFAVHGGAPPVVAELEAGLHVLADGDVDDPSSPRVARARDLAAPPIDAPPARVLADLQRVLADGDPDADPRDRLCRRFARAGTVSSCIVAVPAQGLRSATFLYAGGPPSACPFTDLSADLTGARVAVQERGARLEPERLARSSD